MIGIMNVPIDSPIEFYNAPNKSDTIDNKDDEKQQQLFDKTVDEKKKKKSITYGIDGRVYIDGKPKSNDTPNQLWNELFRRTMFGQIRKSIDHIQKHTSDDNNSLHDQTIIDACVLKSSSSQSRLLSVSMNNIKLRRCRSDDGVALKEFVDNSTIKYVSKSNR